MKVNLDIAEKLFRLQLKFPDGREKLFVEMQTLRVVIFVMVGGGMLGFSAVNQPKDFYLDNRATKRPYKKDDIDNALQILLVYMKVLDLDKETLSSMPTFHNCGVF